VSVFLISNTWVCHNYLLAVTIQPTKNQLIDIDSYLKDKYDTIDEKHKNAINSQQLKKNNLSKFVHC
jgi:hypothetical protein